MHAIDDNENWTDDGRKILYRIKHHALSMHLASFSQLPPSPVDDMVEWIPMPRDTKAVLDVLIRLIEMHPDARWSHGPDPDWKCMIGFNDSKYAVMFRLML